MGLSRRAYARHRGCNESAVRKAIAAGRISVEADGTIDPEKADAAWAANTSRIRGVDDGAPVETKGKANGNGPVSELTRMRAKKLGADTAKVELAVDRLRGGLVDRQQVGKVVFTFFRRLRDAWMAWPAAGITSSCSPASRRGMGRLRPFHRTYPSWMALSK